ncbi:MAG: methyltransferase domain-containing protein [Xanthomonadaceae bacterium]|nr:methyltransferase domain-containing protein [Xanthomonadaceae bacterium]
MSKKITHCRICQTQKFDTIVELGDQAFTGIFPKTKSQQVPTGELTLVKCKNCDLVQLAHNFDLNQMYGMNYGYRSGLNQSMVAHLKTRTQKIQKFVKLSPGDMVVDIGSNDSTLLRSYERQDLLFLGIDPSGVKFKNYYPDYIKLVPEFFSAAAIKKSYPGKMVKALTSIAMFYDLEDPIAFAQQIADALDTDGVWMFEQSYVGAMLKTNSFDTICHEHLEYYGLKQIKWILDAVNMVILDVEFNDVNGGSFCITATKKNSLHPTEAPIVTTILQQEKTEGLFNLDTYKAFIDRMNDQKSKLITFLAEAKLSGKKVFGYGASTKGNVLLQYYGISPSDFVAIAEVNEDKFGSFTPGTLIPILSEKEVKAMKPDYMVVLPWHFKKGILGREKEYMNQGGKMVFPLPELEIVSS